jgi:ribosomal protein S18 acetylase RimI-like enzyme
MHYSEYILEVADTNTPAIRLFEKLGYKEFTRKPAPKKSGFSHFVYMKLVHSIVEGS